MYLPNDPDQATRNFAWYELRCRGCAGTCSYAVGGRPLVHVAPGALAKLQALRDLVAQPLHLNSASRCPLHTARVGGAPLSQHRASQVMQSTAFDILLTLPKPDLIAAAERVGFGGIGINYASFVHVDDRGHRARW